MDPSNPSSESSLSLLRRAQEGDAGARERLFSRYLPRLRQWASGRLPPWARDLNETGDVVQDVLTRTIERIDGFAPRTDGGLHAYLRTAVLNQVRDRMRGAHRHPRADSGLTAEPDPAPSALEQLIGRREIERYEAAFARLDPSEQEAIHLRLELGLEWADVAEAMGKSSGGAARMVVTRAVARLARELQHEGT